MPAFGYKFYIRRVFALIIAGDKAFQGCGWGYFRGVGGVHRDLDQRDAGRVDKPGERCVPIKTNCVWSYALLYRRELKVAARGRPHTRNQVRCLDVTDGFNYAFVDRLRAYFTYAATNGGRRTTSKYFTSVFLSTAGLRSRRDVATKRLLDGGVRKRRFENFILSLFECRLIISLILKQSCLQPLTRSCYFACCRTMQ
jgi:hypothetical protein